MIDGCAGNYAQSQKRFLWCKPQCFLSGFRPLRNHVKHYNNFHTCRLSPFHRMAYFKNSSWKQSYVHTINRKTHGRLKIWNLCSRVYIDLTRTLRSLVRYRFEYLKINSISPSAHVLFSIYSGDQGFNPTEVKGVLFSLFSVLWIHFHPFSFWFNYHVSGICRMVAKSKST